MAEGTPLKVWFVNVGHGDCTIVKFPSGRVMMVDICNSKTLDVNSQSELLEAAGWMDKTARAQYAELGLGQVPLSVASAMRTYETLLDDPINDVLKSDSDLVGQGIFRFILTHPDMDHMTGLYRLIQQEPGIGVRFFWDTNNTKKKAKKTGKGYDEKDWDKYQQIREQNTDPMALQLYRGNQGNFWTDDNMTILSPTKALIDECNDAEDWNNMSQAIRIVHGDSSLILAGDVEQKAQQEMINHFGNGLASTILKAPHHGRDSGYVSDFAKAVSPDYTIVSVGKKPDSDATNKYRYHTKKKVFSTRHMGTIYAELFVDGDVKIWNSQQKGRERIDTDGDEAASLINVPGRTGLRIGG